MLKSYMLAPSKIDRFAQMDVVGALFRGQQFAILDNFKVYVATGEAPPPAEPPLVDMSVDHIPLFYEKMRIIHVGLRIREAAGIPLLGYCMTTICEILRKLKKDETYRVYSEYPVVTTPKQGSCDTALITIVATDQENTRPIFLCEYKPVIDPNCSDVLVNDLLETFVQGYYCLRSRKMESVLHCITDLYRWHCFKLSYVYECFKIEWTKTSIYHQPIPQTEDVKQHYSYLLSVL